VLFRILETTVPDRETRERAVRHALSSAGLDELPLEFEDVLELAREHLAVFLDDPERPWLVSSLLEDLEAEAELARVGHDPQSSARMAIATRLPPGGQHLDRGHAASVDAPSLSSATGATGGYHEPPELEFAELDLLAGLDEAVTHEITVDDDRETSHVARAARVPRIVLMIDPDRFGRASVARALVRERLDVLVRDGANDAIPTIEGDEPFDVVLLDADVEGIDAILHGLARRRPDVRVVLRTAGPLSAAELVGRRAGVAARALGRATKPNAVVEALRTVYLRA
jgi:CheY-like chemotaxis protein